VTTVLHQDGSVSVTNVPSYRKVRNVTVSLPGERQTTGDIAYGGNWFYIVRDHHLAIDRSNIDALTDFTWQLRQAINAQGHPEVDHIILLSPIQNAAGRARNFVLCPGRAYDRSPCGTGTSSILACLAADGTLAEGESWIQESVIGSHFTASFQWLDRERGLISPTISGSAFVTAEGELLLDPRDPFRTGFP
jgi:proline racemase